MIYHSPPLHVFEFFGAHFFIFFLIFLKVTLKLDPEVEMKRFGPKPGPLDEIEV